MKLLVTRHVAAAADATPQYVTRLAREGRIDNELLSDGSPVFPSSAIEQVRQAKAEGESRRGRPARSAGR